jgi:hypothetical protein
MQPYRAAISNPVGSTVAAVFLKGHIMLTSIIILFLPIMLMGCAIVIAEWFDR